MKLTRNVYSSLFVKETVLKISRCVTTIAILAGWSFMMALPPTIYAETSVDINKNPIILIDKQVIERDHRLLKSAQEGGDQKIIKAARQRLQQDIRKMKTDKVALKKSRQKRR